MSVGILVGHWNPLLAAWAMAECIQLISGLEVLQWWTQIQQAPCLIAAFMQPLNNARRMQKEMHR